MANTYVTKVYLEQGGDAIVLKPGGKIKVDDTNFLAVDDDGNIVVDLPTVDPEVEGALFIEKGVLTVSDGPA